MTAKQLYDVIQVLMEEIDSPKSALDICKRVYRLKREHVLGLLKRDIETFSLFGSRCEPLCKRYYPLRCAHCPLSGDVSGSTLCCEEYNFFTEEYEMLNESDTIKDNPEAMELFLALCDKIESLPEN